jgi:hypothetical protein
MLTESAVVIALPVRVQIHYALSHVYNIIISVVFILFHYSVKIIIGIRANRGGTHD